MTQRVPSHYTATEHDVEIGANAPAKPRNGAEPGYFGALTTLPSSVPEPPFVQ